MKKFIQVSIICFLVLSNGLNAFAMRPIIEYHQGNNPSLWNEYQWDRSLSASQTTNEHVLLVERAKDDFKGRVKNYHLSKKGVRVQNSLDNRYMYLWFMLEKESITLTGKKQYTHIPDWTVVYVFDLKQNRYVVAFDVNLA